MHILRPVLLMLLPLPLCVGCGVAKEKHQATLQRLKDCRSELARVKIAHDLRVKERDVAQRRLAALGGQKDVLARRLGASKKELTQLRRQRALAEERSKTYRNLVARLKAMIDSGKLKVRVRKGRMIVQLSDKILFAAGKVKLKEEGRKPLQELAHVLKDIDQRDFLVAGHTDNVPIRRNKRFRSNWELSSARAVEVVKFLQQQGVDPKHLAAAGYSEYDPVGDNDADEGRRKNRRIEIVLMPNIAELP